jgi:hypothetical protein
VALEYEMNAVEAADCWDLALHHYVEARQVKILLPCHCQHVAASNSHPSEFLKQNTNTV